MKTRISRKQNWFYLAMIASSSLFGVEGMVTQTFTVLHSFNYNTNSDGADPYAGLVLSSNTLYGTTFSGGSSSNGTVFKVNIDGTGYTNLHSFTGGSDGSPPYSRLVLSSNTLYGTARFGGNTGNGTVFAVNTDGTGFTNLYSFTALSLFTNGDGAHPVAGLILSGHTLYGTADSGGSSGNGTVFAVNTDGTSFTNLHSLAGGNEGILPYASLILSGGTLYGTASAASSSNSGTIFKLNIDGTGFTNLYSFSTKKNYTNSDGAGPGSLILSGNTLYGATQVGGPSGNGTVFRVDIDGTGFENLHGFTATGYGHINSDGAQPDDVLTLLGNTLYGTTYFGGSWGAGTIFAVNTNGTNFTDVHAFTGASDGGNPQAGLIYSGITLYGTATYGGNWGSGTIFSLSFAPQLSIIHSGTNVILSWPTNTAGFNYTGFTLQCATNLGPPVVWSAVLSASAVVNGLNIISNPITGSQMFYRLEQ